MIGRRMGRLFLENHLFLERSFYRENIFLILRFVAAASIFWSGITADLFYPGEQGQHQDIMPGLSSTSLCHKSNSFKLRSFPAGATISKWQRLLSPIVPFISLIGFIHSPNCSIFRQRFLIQPSVYFTRIDMKYRYLQFAQIWNTILRNAVNCCSARIATLQSNCFQYPG